MIDLSGKTAVVTGGARGIGAAIAGRFAHLGARVAVVDIEGDAARRCAGELVAEGLVAEAHACDVTSREAVAGLMESLTERWGVLDILVNNAGIIRDNRVENITEADWDQVLDVNLKGAFLCCQAVVGHMKDRQYGKIINIISRAWLGNIGQANYSASKGGLVSLTRTLALELARHGIQVNGVAPGLIDTPMTRGLPSRVLDRLIAMQPGRAMGSVDDISAAVAFLASDRGRFITGQILHVDGGKSCGLLSL